MKNCYDTHSYDSTPKWASWLMGGGLLASFLGGIFGGGKSEGAGGASDNTDNTDNTDNNAKLKDDIKALKTQYPDATFSILSDGSIMCDQEKYESLDEVINALKKNYPKTPEKKDKNTTDNSLKTTPDPNNTGGDNANEPLKDKGNKEKTPLELSGYNNFANLDIKSLNDYMTGPLKCLNSNDTTCSEQRGENVNAPVTITVDRNGKKYEFELIDDKSKVKDGHPMYNCISNGRTLAPDEIQEYLLNTKGEFYQTQDTKGLGTDLGDKVKS